MIYCDYFNALSEVKKFPVVGTNEWGENVIIEHYDGDDPCFKVTTFQNNDWVRIIYVYKSGNFEEIYEK
jgi:hypothetical protein